MANSCKESHSMETGIKLWAHQEETIRRAKSPFNYHFLAHDTGTGKTCTVIRILCDKCNNERRLLRTLIVVPPNILYQFKDEVKKYSSIPDECVSVLYGHNQKRLKDLQEKGGIFPDRKGHIFITNYECLLMPKVFEAIKKWLPEVIIGDELHRCKNPSSKRTKALIALGDLSTYRYGMTGTPVLNSIEDLFSQVRFLDKGATLGTNYFSFRARFLYDKNRGMPSQRYFPDWRPQPGAEERLHALIQPFTTRFKKEECIDLPPLVETTIPVIMGPKQEKLYNEMKEDLLTFLDGKEVVATMALTKLLRLQQMASGFCHTFDGKDLEISDSPKADALKEILSDISPNHKTIIWAAWVFNYETIRKVCDELKIGYVELHGGVPIPKRPEIAEKFRKDPSIRVVICHPEATSEGINLVEASYSIVYSRTFSLKHEEQSIARNYRGGSTMHEKVTRINLVTKDTVDEAILKALKQKKDISVKVMDGLKDLLT